MHASNPSDTVLHDQTDIRDIGHLLSRSRCGEPEPAIARLTFAPVHLAAIRLIVTVTPIRLAATVQWSYGTQSVGLAIAPPTCASGILPRCEPYSSP
jgi:hypothetical protein